MIKQMLSPHPHSPPLTIQQHIITEQQRFPDASGEFSFLLSGITLAAKQIQTQVRRAGICNILGEYGSDNVQGESHTLRTDRIVIRLRQGRLFETY